MTVLKVRIVIAFADAALNTFDQTVFPFNMNHPVVTPVDPA